MIPDSLKKWLAFGSGVGIAVEGPRGAESLRVSAVRVRPTGIRTAGGFDIENFAQQPAAEWGAAYSAFTRKMGMRHVPAVVVLPRHEVVLRQVAMPGVSDKDLEGAIAFQLDGMHPWDDTTVVSSWARLGASGTVMVAIARGETINRYTTLFAEAGIKLAGFTCSGPAIYSALRVHGARLARELIAFRDSTPVEIYGESPARGVLSATFQTELDRAVSLASAELRFENPPEAVPLSDLLHAESPLAFAAAVTSACPRFTLPLNLLPVEQRQIGSPWRWALPAALGVAVVVLAIALATFPGYENARYLQTLEAEIAKVQPMALRSSAIDQEVASVQERMALLDDLRGSSKRDMDVLAELTTRLAPPAWVNSLNVSQDDVQVVGEAPEAAPLLRIVDESALFESSEFIGAPARRENAETFRIRTQRTKEPPAAAAVAKAEAKQ